MKMMGKNYWEKICVYICLSLSVSVCVWVWRCICVGGWGRGQGRSKDERAQKTEKKGMKGGSLLFPF